jgi:threonine synthase
MDIQVASNFERAVFEASARQGDWVADAMLAFSNTRRLELGSSILDALRARYAAESVSDEETLATIARVYDETGRLIDPHTAVAAAAAERCNGTGSPLVILSTAHPAKFPDAVRRATGQTPELPPHLSDLLSRDERCTVLPNQVAAVRDFVLERARSA